MGTRHTAEPLQSKIWQLDQDQSSAQGFLYSCNLCDEILVLSKLFINPRKIQLAFSNICPGCDFELDKTLKVQTSTLPIGRRFLTNPICKDPEQLIERICLQELNCLMKPLFSASASLSLFRAKRPMASVISCASEQSILFHGDWIVMSCLLMGATFSTCIPCRGTLSASGLIRRG